MKNCKAIACSLLSVFFASAASAALQSAITVPWEGDITKFHTAVAGQQIILKGVLWANTATTSVQYRWNPGDGKAFSTLTTVSVTPGTPTPVSLNYTYAGSAGTPYVAWLIASDGTTTISNRYLVMLQTASLDANINIAIDDGLWWLYGQSTFSDGVHGDFLTFDGSPCLVISGYSSEVHAGPTASAVQAFEINGSLQSGNWNQDPYAQAVAYGLNWILKGYFINTSYPMLDAMNITTGGTTAEGNPDENGNGIGIEVNDGYYLYRPIYQGGQVMDALVASGTPNASTGRQFISGHTATFKDVVQDMVDQYSWGQWTGTENFTVVGPPPVSNPANLTTLGAPDSLTFTVLATSCGAAGTYTFKLNGITVGTYTPPNASTATYTYCSCTPGFQTVVVSGAALSSAWGTAASPPNIEVVYSGGYYVASVGWTLDFGGTPYTSAVFEGSGLQGLGDADLCDGDGNPDAFDIVQDLNAVTVQGSSTTKNGIIGGWRYTWGTAPDNSTSQWAAIGAIAAEQAPWNCLVPSFVTNYDNNWCWYSFAVQSPNAWGKFGYTSSASLGYPNPPSSSTTPSGLVQLNNDGIPTNDFRWSQCEAYFQNNWDTGEDFLPNGLVNFYSLYSFTKAHRTALPNPVVNFPNGFDWYRGSTGHAGIATSVSSGLIGNSGAWPSTYWEGQQLATAWAVIVLKPNLFSAGPVACFSANPNPGFANIPISFDPTCSTDPNAGGIANLVKFDWNWGDGTADTITATPDVVTHAFACTSLPCSYQVTLTVYDNSNPQLNSSAQQTINITQPPHPPVSVPGGPYVVSLCSCDSLTLNGSGSFSPDVGLKQENCTTCPVDGITAYGWALTGVPYTYTGSSDEIVMLGSGFTSFFPTANTYEIGLQVTDNAAASFPAGTTSNLIGDAFTSVTVYNCGPNNVTATPGCLSVSVSWTAEEGATSYSVLSSTSGPNSGFTVVATVGAGVTSTPIAATLGEVQWIRVQAVTGNGTTMSCVTEVTNTFVNCICISDLTLQSKETIVELQWPLVDGATSYNVYRSTAPNVNMIPANRIATGLTRGLYVDGGLTNGKTYYYRVSSVTDGVETCRSIEVSGTPAVPKR